MAFSSAATSMSSACAAPVSPQTSPMVSATASAGMPKSFAIAVVIELPPMFSRRGKILPGSQKSRFVVRDPMSSRMVQPSASG